MDCSTFAFDLHVLGTPPALILSQDQTLMLNSSPFDSPAFTGSLRDNSLTRGRCIGSALFNPFLLKVVHRQSPSHGLKTPVDRLTRCHPLTLIVSRPRPLLRKNEPLDGLCVLARLSSFQRTDGNAPVAPYPTSARSHRPGPAWKALPPVGRGVFRGTLRGYYRHPPLSTSK